MHSVAHQISDRFATECSLSLEWFLITYISLLYKRTNSSFDFILYSGAMMGLECTVWFTKYLTVM